MIDRAIYYFYAWLFDVCYRLEQVWHARTERFSKRCDSYEIKYWNEVKR